MRGKSLIDNQDNHKQMTTRARYKIIQHVYLHLFEEQVQWRKMQTQYHNNSRSSWMETKLCFVTNTGASYKPILLNVEVNVLHHAIFASTVRPSTRNFKLNDLTRLGALCVRCLGAVYTWVSGFLSIRRILISPESFICTDR